MEFVIYLELNIKLSELAYHTYMTLSIIIYKYHM